mmetsp:Transcript_21126/g.68355  ORF Transcript_21126/g.68355 Transcript_21126/m.68355 type:complete len:224 (+) Transcript_21126:1762-2433(+)
MHRHLHGSLHVDTPCLQRLSCYGHLKNVRAALLQRERWNFNLSALRGVHSLDRFCALASIARPRVDETLRLLVSRLVIVTLNDRSIHGGGCERQRLGDGVIAFFAAFDCNFDRAPCDTRVDRSLGSRARGDVMCPNDKDIVASRDEHPGWDCQGWRVSTRRVRRTRERRKLGLGHDKERLLLRADAGCAHPPLEREARCGVDSTVGVAAGHLRSRHEMQRLRA